MPSSAPHTSLSAESVAEFLADREGLAGLARRRFLEVLKEYGSFRQASRPHRARTLILVSLLLALIGFVLDYPPDLSDGMVWSVCVLLAVVPVWRFHREETQAYRPDPEIDWQAYCLFLRPVILTDHPGLLEQTANDLRQRSAYRLFRPLPMLRNLVHERGPDFWWSAILGLWCGMVTLVVIRLGWTTINPRTSLVFPIGGLVLGPVLWTLWKRVIYAIAHSDSRLS
jgi:hypothetical protein